MEIIQGNPVVSGSATGDLLVSQEPMSFWGGYDATNGNIIDTHHPLCGENAREKVLGIPFTIGSSTTAAVFLQSIRDKTSPAAIITIGADDFLALASIVAEEMYDSPIPIISVTESDYKKLITGTHVQINQSGEIRIR